MPQLTGIVVGAGPIGLSLARALRKRPDFTLGAVIDNHPQKVGADAGVLLDGQPWGLRVTEEVPDASAGAVAFVGTHSHAQRIAPLLLSLVARGYHIVTTCEELVWPYRRHADIAVELDSACRKQGVSIVATGVNPGFVMDTWPLLMTAVCHDVTHVRVERVQDASKRRLPFMHKVGVGAEPAAFAAALKANEVGHMGLCESAEMIAMGLSLVVDDVQHDAQVIVADSDVVIDDRQVAKGQVLGVEQTARVLCGGVERVELYFRATFGEVAVRDRVIIRGEPSFEVTAPTGLHGDVATAAIAINAAHQLVRTSPGFHTMASLPLVRAQLAYSGDQVS